MALDFADLLEQPTKPASECGICYILRTEDAESKRKLEEVLAFTGATFKAIADKLTSNGHDVDQQTVSRHAQGQCRARKRYR